MKVRSPLLILTLIIILGAFLRLNGFLFSPPGFHIDESDIGYQAYSLLKTGRDYYGNFLPIHPQSFVDRRPFLYMYLLLPFIKFLGLNTLAVRFPSLLFGTLTIPAIYYLSRHFSSRLGLSAALILAILPWHIHYSRVGYELTTMLFLLTVGIGFLIRWLDNQKVFYLNLGLVFSLLTIYTYATAKLVVPLILLALLLPKFKRLPKLSLALVGVFLIPIIWDTLHGIGGERFKVLSIFTDTNGISQYLHLRWLATYTHFWGKFYKIFLSNPVYFFYQIAANYLNTFSPQYLIFNGDPNPRHVVPASGVAGFSITILFILGVYMALRRSPQSLKYLFFALLLITPLAAAITRDGQYHSTRLFLVILPLSLFAGFGLSQLLTDFRRRVFQITLICLILLLSFEVIRDQFLRLGVYPISGYSSFNYGWEELVQKINQHKKKFTAVLIDNSEGAPIQTLYAFYKKANPIDFQLLAKSADIYLEKPSVGAKRFTFDNVFFTPLNLVVVDTKKWHNLLLVLPAAGNENDKLNKFNVVDKVDDPLHRPLFYLLTVKD